LHPSRPKPVHRLIAVRGRLRSGLALALACGLGVSSVQAEERWQDTFYVLGTLMAEQLAELAPEADELDALVDGLRDQFAGRESRVDVMEQIERIPELISERRRAALLPTLEAGDSYLQAFVAEGATVTDSGLAYRVVNPGEGEPPSVNSVVEVHYEGRLIDGTVFDSSYQRGQTARFPLGNVISGWTEGLQYVAPGGQITLVIPPDLAYGDEGSPPRIPGGSTLVFDVELIAVED